MLVKMETTKFLIYAELDTPERGRDTRIWQLRTGSDRGRATRSSMRLSNAVIFKSHGALPVTGIPILFGSRGQINGYLLSLLENQITASVETDNLTATTTRQSPSLHFVSTRIIEQCIQAISV